MEIIDRKSGKKFKEKIYYEKIIRFFYGKSSLGSSLAKVTATYPFFSKFFGFLQTLPSSKKKILPFIEKYQVNTAEFLDPVASFNSFNEFFTRKLKPETRPIAQSDAIIPTDGRFLFYQDIEACDGYVLKGEKFSLASLIGSETLAEKYLGGSMVIGRLNPTDYHRFHFPCNGKPSLPRMINGFLYSVNPIALKENLSRFTKNKRCVTTLESPNFGMVLLIEVGATNVGSIKQTYTPNENCLKGDEKGFFEFGASAIVLLFEKNKIIFDKDLCVNSTQHIETLCIMGQSLGNKK